MTNPTPRPSGPLWAPLNAGGELSHANSTFAKVYTNSHPCRLIPGHGKVVPLELVEAIAAEYNRLLMRIPAPADGPCRAAMSATTAAIRAALEGAV